MRNKGTVLVIGASGMVGLDTVEKLHRYVPDITILTYDGPARDIMTIENRQKRIELYNKLAQNDKLIDQIQGNWILGDRQELPLAQRSKKEVAADIASSFSHGVDTIVLTAGLGRKPTDKNRSDMIERNVPIIALYGKEIADAYVARLEVAPNLHFPIIISVGNPMDTMLDVLHESIRVRLEELRETHPKFKEQIDAAINRLPVLLIGQGGVLDSARAAYAISEKTKIPLSEIKNVTVLGPHNDDMRIVFESVTVMHEGKEIRLQDHPLGKSLDKEEILKETRGGGKAVMTNNGGQSAVFGTAAAILPMVEASLSDKPITLVASRKNPFSEVAIGELISLSRKGAFQPDLISLGGTPEIIKGGHNTQKDSEFAREKLRERAAHNPKLK